MELKTLKDFKVDPKSWAGAMANAGRKYTIDIDGLREEAIKHYKHIEKEMNTEGSLADVKHCDCSAEWIKHFFNLTEKDLK